MKRDPQRMVQRCWKRLLPDDGETWRRTFLRADLDVIDPGQWQRIVDSWLGPPMAAARHLGLPLNGELALDDVSSLDRVTLTVRFSRG